MKSYLVSLVWTSFVISSAPMIVGCVIPEDITAEEARLMLRIPDLKRAEGEFGRALTWDVYVEIGYWVPAGDFGPIASLIYLKPRRCSDSIVDGNVVLTATTMPERVRHTFPKKTRFEVSIGESGQSSNHFGKLEYQKFALGRHMQCVYMYQLFGTSECTEVATSNKAPAPGEAILAGWYCSVPEYSPLSQRAITLFFEGVGIKGQ